MGNAGFISSIVVVGFGLVLVFRVRVCIRIKRRILAGIEDED